MDHAVAVTPPRLSDDGDTALLIVQYDVPVTHPDLLREPRARSRTPSRRPATPGSRSSSAGSCPSTAAAPMDGNGELIGIVAALLILVLAFGSVVGAGLPDRRRPGRAWRSAPAGSPCWPRPWTSAPPPRWSPRMVGLGVGIDYALLLVTRHVEYLRAGPRRARGGRARRGHRRPLGGLRLRDRAGLAAGPAAGRAADVLRLRLRHRDRRRRGRARRADPGAGARAGSPAAGCCPARCAQAASTDATRR